MDKFILYFNKVRQESCRHSTSRGAKASLKFIRCYRKLIVFFDKFLLHPESDDSAQLSQIETGKLLAELVEAEINRRLPGHRQPPAALRSFCCS
ncbi:hypothetical protein E3N88_21751 [Mikania micrantha]|uniref:Uncharacterized protein n=1 Tax=Mikania micrantha TaxID=192012 RepID=A0A5N6NAA8_9ASTR|nr:hypothetical protein E3N88_21751 [Mikania micrantha]